MCCACDRRKKCLLINNILRRQEIAVVTYHATVLPVPLQLLEEQQFFQLHKCVRQQNQADCMLPSIRAPEYYLTTSTFGSGHVLTSWQIARSARPTAQWTCWTRGPGMPAFTTLLSITTLCAERLSCILTLQKGGLAQLLA